jgi:hypothetical protein
MADICAHEPVVIAVLKTVGPTLALVGAIFAWLANNLVSWCGWAFGRSVRCYEAMKALNAEIRTNNQQRPEIPDIPTADALIEYLKADLGPDKPLTPYWAGVAGNPVFDHLVETLAVLPARVSESVVEYYNRDAWLTALRKDFTSEAYKELSHARQEAVIRSLFRADAKTREVADSALETIELHLQRYQIALGLLLAAGAIALLLGVPAVIGASKSLVKAFTSAAEWASTCDMIPKK